VDDRAVIRTLLFRSVATYPSATTIDQALPSKTAATQQLALALLMSWIAAHDEHHAPTANDLAALTDPLNTRANFHKSGLAMPAPRLPSRAGGQSSKVK
jgi:hypothetical protein